MGRKDIMSRRLALLALTAGLTVAALATSALAGPSATSSVGVEIQSQDLTGVAPNGTPATIQVKAVVAGENASSLAGELRLFRAGGAHGYGTMTGSLVGNIVTLSGVLTQSNIGLAGTPIKLEANSSSGAITVTLGPRSSGPFVGTTTVFEGFGSVKIKTS
jgi:hypothetical protein